MIHRNSWLLAAVLVVWMVWLAPARAQDDGAPGGRADGLTDLDPASADAKPNVAYRWTSGVRGLVREEDGRVKASEFHLRYTWVLPEGYEKSAGCDLVVICHGTGLDYRWGHWNFKPRVFRARDVVVSVDGTTEGPEGTRLFLGQRPDALAFRDVLLELGRTFHARRVYLYGHSQGSFFVVYFAGEFPRLVDGVVAQSSGAWDWSADTGAVQKVPLVFLHGTADPVVPYDQSRGARDAYAAAGHPMVRLRRMPRFNHWPNAVRASECVEWCIGMRTDRAGEALAAAESMLAPKGPDEYEYVCPVDFGGARQILRRFELKPPKESEDGVVQPPPPPPGPFKEVDAATAERARALAEKIEREGQRHVDALKGRIKSRSDLTLDAGAAGAPSGEPAAWIGHLAAMREDFRGVDCVEAYAKAIDYDAVLAEQIKAGEAIEDVWYVETPDPKVVFGAAVEALPKCFLFEGLPAGMAKKLKEWEGKGAELGISAEVLGKAGVIERWREGWEVGLKEYGEMCKGWK